LFVIGEPLQWSDVVLTTWSQTSLSLAFLTSSVDPEVQGWRLSLIINYCPQPGSSRTSNGPPMGRWSKWVARHPGT